MLLLSSHDTNRIPNSIPGERSFFFNAGLGSYRAVLPVADNLLQIGGGVEQEMLPPFIPVQSHGAVHVNAAHRQNFHHFYLKS